jgi:predicted enzyme related to lactoylglutathione lyase
MQVIALAGLVLSSPNPGALAAFYKDRLGVPLEDAHHGQGAHFEGLLNRTHIAVWSEAERGSPREPDGPVVPVFVVRDVREAVESARNAGTPIALEPLDIGEGKLVASLLDPDGRVVRLIQFGVK